ncbi:hypothetical protein RYX36_031790 [Vicia faba]
MRMKTRSYTRPKNQKHCDGCSVDLIGEVEGGPAVVSDGRTERGCSGCGLFVWARDGWKGSGDSHGVTNWKESLKFMLACAWWIYGCGLSMLRSKTEAPRGGDGMSFRGTWLWRSGGCTMVHVQI